MYAKIETIWAAVLCLVVGYLLFRVATAAGVGAAGATAIGAVMALGLLVLVAVSGRRAGGGARDEG